MKKMKFAKFFLPAIAIMAIALGNTPAQAAQKIKIGVAMALFDDVWLTNVRDAMTKWATTHPDVELTIVDAANDTAKQVGQVENFLAQGMDAIVILPVDTAATGPDDQGSHQSRESLWSTSTASRRTCRRVLFTLDPSLSKPGS